MRDTSVYLGWKELTGKNGTVSFEDENYQWAVYEHDGNRKNYTMRIKKIPHETNKHLYQRYQYLTYGYDEWSIKEMEKYDKEHNNNFYRNC